MLSAFGGSLLPLVQAVANTDSVNAATRIKDSLFISSLLSKRLRAIKTPRVQWDLFEWQYSKEIETKTLAADDAD
jgi:hypothetical protein